MNNSTEYFEHRVKKTIKDIEKIRKEREKTIFIDKTTVTPDNPENYEIIVLKELNKTIDYSLFTNAVKLHVHSGYCGMLPRFSKIRELSISNTDWEELKRYDLSELEELIAFTMPVSKEVIEINAPKLRYFHLSLCEAEKGKDFQRIDLSKCHALHTLIVHNSTVDWYYMCGLPNIKRLFVDRCYLNDLGWLTKYLTVEELSLHACELTDISSICFMKNLRKVDLALNKVTSFTELTELPFLEEAIIFNNPFNHEEIAQLKEKCLIIASMSERDCIFAKENSDDDMVYRSVIEKVNKDNETPLNQLPMYRRQVEENERKKPVMERYLKEFILQMKLRLYNMEKDPIRNKYIEEVKLYLKEKYDFLEGQI